MDSNRRRANGTLVYKLLEELGSTVDHGLFYKNVDRVLLMLAIVNTLSTGLAIHLQTSSCCSVLTEAKKTCVIPHTF